MRAVIVRSAAASALLLAAATPSHAQSVADVLTFLVTNQSLQTGSFERDRDAAQATSETISRAVLANLATLPVTTSSGAFVYRLNSELGTVERRLRAAQGEPRHGESNAQSLPGLRTTAVGDELVAYFGEDSRGGLLVVEADSSWAPIRTGDVILSVDGEAADIGRLRNALDPRRETRVELLRRGRSLTVRLHPGA